MRVVWEIEIEDVATHQEAAATAQQIARDPLSTATVFVVDGVVVDLGVTS